MIDITTLKEGDVVKVINLGIDITNLQLNDTLKVETVSICHWTTRAVLKTFCPSYIKARNSKHKDCFTFVGEQAFVNLQKV